MQHAACCMLHAACCMLQLLTSAPSLVCIDSQFPQSGRPASLHFKTKYFTNTIDKLILIVFLNRGSWESTHYDLIQNKNFFWKDLRLYAYNLHLPPLPLSGSLLHSLDSSLHNLPHMAKPSKFGLNGLSEPQNELMVLEVHFQVLTNAGKLWQIVSPGRSQGSVCWHRQLF